MPFRSHPPAPAPNLSLPVAALGSDPSPNLLLSPPLRRRSMSTSPHPRAGISCACFDTFLNSNPALLPYSVNSRLARRSQGLFFVLRGSDTHQVLPGAFGLVQHLVRLAHQESELRC